MHDARLSVRFAAAACVMASWLAAAPGAQVPALDVRHSALDQLLDLYVRDGLVYYTALKADRARLDRYLASLDGPQANAAAYARWTHPDRLAFWINAYNALALRIVVDHYPIQGASPDYPPHSIRLIPGAFDRLTMRAAGRTVTLDAIEKEILPEFRDPRVYFALGRASVGGGRLRSEAFTPERLGVQLKEVERELPTRAGLFNIDREANRVVVTPIVGWHEKEFAAAYPEGPAVVNTRSPIERAIVALIAPHLLPSETAFLEKNEFAVTYGTYDWSLNDLSGR